MTLSKVPVLLFFHFIINFSTSLSDDTSCRLINLEKARITLTEELGDLKPDRDQLECVLASARNEAEELRERLKNADAELNAMILMLEKHRKGAGFINIVGRCKQCT